MIIVLNAVNLPVEDISLLLAVDWFLDRFRTAANVSGDTIGVAVVQKLCDKHLQVQPPNNDKSTANSLYQLPSADASIFIDENDLQLGSKSENSGSEDGSNSILKFQLETCYPDNASQSTSNKSQCSKL